MFFSSKQFTGCRLGLNLSAETGFHGIDLAETFRSILEAQDVQHIGCYCSLSHLQLHMLSSLVDSLLKALKLQVRRDAFVASAATSIPVGIDFGDLLAVYTYTVAACENPGDSSKW
ncbi:hypothetical protein HNY73_017921 [Argiope bruennichi]|uniref:Uncharacterized protein n=1 Tax=Argiope bruennichi TaxID=94029 RepID=A0A8T0EC46_ARGBR|nr:hypothetical protein HNY73_017921 [Argiope bruennichi]